MSCGFLGFTGHVGSQGLLVMWVLRVYWSCGCLGFTGHVCYGLSCLFAVSGGMLFGVTSISLLLF